MDVRVRFRLSGQGCQKSSQESSQKTSEKNGDTPSANSAERAVTVPTGSRLIDAIARAGLPLASACGADGLCGRCGVEVLVGGSKLAPETKAESRIKERNRIDPELRLACRTLVPADLEITASYW